MNKQTQDIVKKMLTENTGRHICDSGGAYGRHWEKNQGRDFEAEPPTLAEFSIYQHKEQSELDIQITHNLYHWLTSRLDYSERVDNIFTWYCNRKSQVDLSWQQNIANFLDYLKPDSICGDRPMGENTYNGDCLLSQTIQYNQFSIDNIDLVLLEIHGGCDVRGGYTKPRVFECDESLFDYCQASLYAENTLDQQQEIMPWGTKDNSHSWYTDDGYNFYGNEYNDLKTYNVTDDPQLKGKGLVFVEDGNAYSPINGSQLEASE